LVFTYTQPFKKLIFKAMMGYHKNSQDIFNILYIKHRKVSLSEYRGLTFCLVFTVSDEEDVGCANVVFCKFEVVSHVGVWGWGFGKGWGQKLVGNGTVQFSTWVQSGVKFAPCTDGHHQSKGFFASKNPMCKLSRL
jgi:hypothetical protein